MHTTADTQQMKFARNVSLGAVRPQQCNPHNTTIKPDSPYIVALPVCQLPSFFAPHPHALNNTTKTVTSRPDRRAMAGAEPVITVVCLKDEFLPAWLAVGGPRVLSGDARNNRVTRVSVTV